MDALFEKTAGIDVHRDTVVVTVRQQDEGAKKARVETRTFETYADTLAAMAQWLETESVECIGLESTGVYWKPVVRALRLGAPKSTVWLVNPAAIKQVPGRKTDVNDSQWLARLVQCGLVRPSYLPVHDLAELRTLTRHRRSLVREATSLKNRLIKQVEASGIKLATVCSDVLGKSGRTILRALLEGGKTPAELADLALGALRKKLPLLERALLSQPTEAARFVLRQLLDRLEGVEQDVLLADAEIQRRLASYASEVDLLAAIPGFDRVAIAVVLAEMGPDTSVFQSADHLASWAGLSPGSHESGGTRKDAPCRKGNEPLRTGLVQAAWAAVRTNGTFWKKKFGQLVHRLGAKKAIVAIARKLLVSIYWALRERRYVEPTVRHDPARTARKAALHVEQLKALGFEVQIRPASTAAA